MKKTLAIFGGKKVRKSAMPFRKAFGKDEIKSIKKVINYYKKKKIDPPYRGKFERDFSLAFEKYMGGGFVCAVATGTASIYVALQALNLKPKSEIIISPFVDSGPVNSIILLGYTPVFADTPKGNQNAMANNFLSKVTKKTSAVILVHTAGEPVESTKFLIEQLRKKKIKLLEDCSQAPGAKIGNKKVGSFGDIACFSTMYRKTLSSGASGGIIFTKNKGLFNRVLAFSDRGKPIWKSGYEYRNQDLHLFPALNWNTDEFSCAVGKSSLKRLDKSNKLRLRFANLLRKTLKKKSKICSINRLSEGATPFYLPVWVEAKKIKCTKKFFAKALLKEGINLNPDYRCLPSGWKWIKKYLKQPLKIPNANNARENSFNLFLNEKYTNKEIKDIISAIVKVEKYYSK